MPGRARSEVRAQFQLAVVEDVVQRVVIRVELAARGARPEISRQAIRFLICSQPRSKPIRQVLAEEIADDLRSALAQIEDILGDLVERA